MVQSPEIIHIWLDIFITFLVCCGRLRKPYIRSHCLPLAEMLKSEVSGITCLPAAHPAGGMLAELAEFSSHET